MAFFFSARMTAYVAAALTLLPCTAVQAVTQVFEYKNFYDDPMRIAAADKPVLQARLAYFLVNPQNGQICQIRQIVMSSGRHQEVLQPGADQEIKIPLDTNLRSLNPNLTMDINAEQPCSLSVQVVSTLPMTTQIEGKQLAALVKDMNEVYQRLGTFVTRRYMPHVSGLVLHFPVADGKVLGTTSKNPLYIKNHILTLNTEQMVNIETDLLTFPAIPEKITPFIQQHSTKN